MTSTVETLPESPSAIRELIRGGRWRRPTVGVASGYVQANLAILPRSQAFDFLLFCQRNPRPCPLLEVLEPGVTEPAQTAPGADIRTDLPLYRVYRRGKLVDEVDDIRGLWRWDLVSFLLGCSFTFEAALQRERVPLRHVALDRNVPMYITNVETRPAGRFSGPQVVSMRPIPRDLVQRAVEVTARYPRVHGAPIHVGAPQAIGIANLDRPDYGDPPDVHPGDVPVFWACGVTPQAVAVRSRPSLMITHAPGHMFITDLRDQDLA